jgi:hypothetical protein
MQVINDSISFVSPLLLNKFIRLIQQGVSSQKSTRLAIKYSKENNGRTTFLALKHTLHTVFSSIFLVCLTLMVQKNQRPPASILTSF